MVLGCASIPFHRLNLLLFWSIPPSLFFFCSAQKVGRIRSWSNSNFSPSNVKDDRSAWKKGKFRLLFTSFEGLSSFQGYIDSLCTTSNLRTPKMRWENIPQFVWWNFYRYFTSGIFDYFVKGITMLLFHRIFNSFFLYFWRTSNFFRSFFLIFRHPEVYILILPGIGLLSQAIYGRFRKKTLEYAGIRCALTRNWILRLLVWAHHIFTMGVDFDNRSYFTKVTVLLVVPTGLKNFRCVRTIPINQETEIFLLIR